jgi:ABC-2 type transport system permease protein
MNIATGTWLLLLRKVRETLRQPVWVLIILAFPLGLLAFYAPLLHSLAGGPGFRGGNVLDVFVPGMLVMLAYFSALFSGQYLLMELGSGVIERLQVTPVSRFALLMGSILRDVLAMIFPGLVLIAVSLPFGFRPNWLGIAVLMVLLTLLTVATGAASTALALISKRVETMSAVVNATLFPLLMLSGMMLPLSMGPRWMQIAAHFNPLYYVTEAARDLGAAPSLQSVLNGTVGEAFAITGVLAVVATWWATRVYRNALA